MLAVYINKQCLQLRVGKKIHNTELSIIKRLTLREENNVVERREDKFSKAGKEPKHGHTVH